MISLLVTMALATEINCNNYGPNEYRSFSGPTMTQNNYRGYSVRKNDDETFTLGFNPEFVGGDLTPKFNECFREGSYDLKTPLGKKISIRKDLIAPKIKITVRTGKSFRQFWSPNIDCLEMAHELMHWAGLCDEYKLSMAPCRRVRENNFLAYSRKANEYTNTLLDDQLNQILYPGCPINEEYRRCSQYAYERDSRKCQLPPNCEQVFVQEKTATEIGEPTPTPIDP